jgi:EAL domain-containing protein (putative c-di-GMP-specific phosphodiesterase class I)
MAQTNIALIEIADALANDEFLYYYQPKVSMLTGEICGAEALIRWQRPDGNLISPAAFIPLAESSGFINVITLAMFQKLIVDMNIINSAKESLVISFNASAKDFHNNKLSEAIRYAVEHKQLAAEQLEVELTETVMLNEDDDVKRNLDILKEMGISLAMDDYGMGVSSIDTLAKWPFSTIKLDQGIISNLETSDKELTIVQSSIQMAHQLGLDIVAEGIESEAVYLILKNMGCMLAQGYWISRPIALAGFLEFCRSSKRWPIGPIGVIRLAQLDHIQWRKAIIDGVFYVGLRRNSHKIRGMPEADPTACRLGRWYYGPGKRFAGTEWYDNFEGPHNRLHQIGEEILEAAKRDASKDELSSLIRQLTSQSIVVISMLQEIEADLMSVSENDAIERSPEDDAQ